MNVQQEKTLIEQVKAMQSEDHTLLFAYVAQTREFHPPVLNSTEEILKSWRKFRAQCKRSDTFFQGVRRFKTTKKHKRQLLEVALFVPNDSIKVVEDGLSTAFQSPDFKTTIMHPLTKEGAMNYIENIMLRPDEPNARPTLINATPNPLATQTQQ